MSSESVILHAVMLRCGRGAVRLFRANSGVGWVGKIVRRTAREITLADPRPFHGMPAGFSDLVGWRTVTITPDMVGTQIAQFIAVETKAPGGRPRPDQRRFADAVERAGGKALTVRDAETAALELDG